MTPAERIAAALAAWDEVCFATSGHWPEPTSFVLDALCPKGERVVLDRTGDTDRIIRQRRCEVDPVIGVTAESPMGAEWILSGELWLDTEDGPDE